MIERQIEMFFYFIIIFAGLFTLIFTVASYQRFNKGEFKNILKWVILAYFFAYSHFVIHILSFNSNLCYLPTIYHLFADLTFVIAILCAFQSGRKIFEFSKIFGFATKQMKKKK
jgi:hypothetical protein